MRNATPSSLEEVTNWGELTRYLVSQRIPPDRARSFVQLAKDSEYIPETEQFRVRSCHAYYTKPRLDGLNKLGLLCWGSASEEGDYQKRFYWIPAATFGTGIHELLLELKRKSEKDEFIDFQ